MGVRNCCAEGSQRDLSTVIPRKREEKTLIPRVEKPLGYSPLEVSFSALISQLFPLIPAVLRLSPVLDLDTGPPNLTKRCKTAQNG